VGAGMTDSIRECDRCGAPWPASSMLIDDDGYYTCPACQADDERLDWEPNVSIEPSAGDRQTGEEHKMHLTEMNLTEFAHIVGLALRHYGALKADERMVSQTILHDDLPAYSGLTAATRLMDTSIPMAQAGFRPVVIDGVLAYGHRTASGRLTIDLFPDSGTGTLRFEAGGDRHILSVHLLFTGGDVFATVEAGDLSLLEGREDRLGLLGRIDRQCGGRIRAALESAEVGLGSAAIRRVLDALKAGV